MDGIVTVNNLIVRRSYILLRYASYEHVPTKSSIDKFLSSKFNEKYELMANDPVYIHTDPKNFHPQE